MPKKILVLVMSCNEKHFVEQENVVRETWAKPILNGEVEGMDYWSYTSSCGKPSHIDYRNHVIYCNTGDGIYETYQKTIEAFKLIKDDTDFDFDFIYRTNTSCVLNYGLLRQFVETIEDPEILYGGELYSIGIPCPFKECLYLRGNSMIMSRYHFNALIDMDKYVEVPSTMFADDNVIGNVLNSLNIMKLRFYTYYIRSYGFAWYKSSVSKRYCNGASSWNNTNDGYEYLKNFIAIQVKSYDDRTLENDRIRHISSIVNVDKNDYTQELDFIRRYMNDPYYWHFDGDKKVIRYEKVFDSDKAAH